MSVDYKCYVGPYIKVFNPEKDSTEEYHSCPNKKCDKHKKQLSDKFCPSCGTKITLVTFPCKSKIDFDIYKEFKKEPISEVMCESKPKELENYDFYISNSTKSPGININVVYEHFIKDFNETIIVSEVQQFEIQLSKEINRLKEVFGNENVQIKWGVMTWTS